MTFTNVAFACGITHNSTESRHFLFYAPVPRLPVYASAVLLSPEWIAVPFLFGNVGNLHISDIGIQVQANMTIDNLPSGHSDLFGLGPTFNKIGVFFRYIGKGFLEHGNFVFNAKAYIGIHIECFFFGFVNIGCFEGYDFVAVCARYPDAHIPVFVFYIGPAEDNQAAL